MPNSYEHDQEKIVNAIGQTVQNTVTTGANLWLSRPKSVKIEVSTIPTVSKDIEVASQAIAKGDSREEVTKMIEKGKMFQKVKQNEGNSENYSNLIVKAASIIEAVKQKIQRQNPELQQDIKKTKGMGL